MSYARVVHDSRSPSYPPLFKETKIKSTAIRSKRIANAFADSSPLRRCTVYDTTQGGAVWKELTVVRTTIRTHTRGRYINIYIFSVFLFLFRYLFRYRHRRSTHAPQRRTTMEAAGVSTRKLSYRCGRSLCNQRTIGGAN